MSLKSLAWRPIAEHLAALYGFKAGLLGHFMFWQAADDPRVWMVPANTMHPQSAEDLESLGWPSLTAPLPEGSATGDVLKMLAANATINVIEVDTAQAEALAAGGCVSLMEDAKAGTPVQAVRQGHLGLGGWDPASQRFLASAFFQ